MENKVLKLGGGEIYPRCICRTKKGKLSEMDNTISKA